MDARNCTISKSLGTLLITFVLRASATAHAQAHADCPFNDLYWTATCPSPGYSAGCHRWHLVDEDPPIADIRACPVWDLGYTGSGITIGIIDLGIRITHEDLVNRHNASASTPHCDKSSHLCLGHGTQIAGLIAAEPDNQLGIVGVAHGASFSEIVVHETCVPCEQGSPIAPTDDELACALRFKNDLNHIKSVSISGGVVKVNSNDNCAGLGNCSSTGTCVAEAIEDAATAGRNGLGTVLVVSAGNDGTNGGRTDYNRFTSHRYTLAVGGATHEDIHWCEADPGSSLFLVAPSGDTSDCGGLDTVPPWELWTAHGFGDALYTAVVGTSYSTPIVAGVVALVLEADIAVHGMETMRVRDVMHAFANTSRQLDAQDPGWESNNGMPAHHIHYNYGFGAVDAFAAVTHITDPGWRRALAERIIDSGMIDPDITIAANDGQASQTFTVQSGLAGNHLRVEHVEIVLNTSILSYTDAPTTDMGDLRVKLVGPDVGGNRTESLFAEFRDGETAKTYNDFVFTSVRHWDELAVGDWTIELENRGDDPIFWHGYQVRIYGTPWCRGDFDADGVADQDDQVAYAAAFASQSTGLDGGYLADYDGVPGLQSPGDPDAFDLDWQACQNP